MAKQITESEIESLIKEKMKTSGADISDANLVQRIKESILHKYHSEKLQSEAENTETNGDPGDDQSLDVDISSEPTPTDTDTVSPDSVQKEVSTDLKQQELDDKEKSLAVKEEELNRKEEELKYKPQLPNPLKEVGKEEFFVFDENQLSLGGEALSNLQLYLKNNPEVKSSVHAEWLNKGMTRADLYKVEFKKIGELQFNPFNGTTQLTQFTESAPVEDSTPKGFPVETVVVNDGGQETDIFDSIIKEKIDNILMSKLGNK